MAFVGFLRQSTAVDLPVGPFLDSTDGNTVEGALTITQPDVRLKKNGAAWAQKNAAQTLSHEENGHYEVALDATDTNTLGQLRLVVHESGGLQVVQDYMVVVASVWDLFCLRGLAMLGLVAYGTAQGGAAGNIQLAAATAFGDDIVNGGTVAATGGTGVGQSRVISNYTGATDTADVDPNFGTAPDATTEYSVFATPPAPASAAAVPATNLTHIAGVAVSTTTAQLGVNVVTHTGNVGVKKNTALAAFMFQMFDSTNHAPATGKTVTVTRSVDGGAFAAGTLGAVTEVSGGWYKVDFGAGDLNGNVIAFRATAAACDDTNISIITGP